MSEEETVRILRRDMLLLSALAACAVGLFLVTKTVAAREETMESRVAATWYQDGVRKFRTGAVEKSIESFRKATGIDRENRTYVLALADALAAGNHNLEAQEALLRLRESDPTNAEINLHLATLAAKSDGRRSRGDAGAPAGALPGRQSGCVRPGGHGGGICWDYSGSNDLGLHDFRVDAGLPSVCAVDGCKYD